MQNIPFPVGINNNIIGLSKDLSRTEIKHTV